MKSILIQTNRQKPWLTELRFSFDLPLKDFIKQFPGSLWEPINKTWSVPREFEWEVAEMATKRGFHFNGRKVVKPDRSEPEEMVSDYKQLYRYQLTAIKHACYGSEKEAWLFNDEMGLGKTPEIITCLKEQITERFIIVCPAMARQTWIDELAKWWPNHPEIGVATTGEKAESLTTPIRIVSYGLLHKLAIHKEPDAIIFDEIHYLQNENSQRSKAALRLIRQHPKAWRAGATATLITNEPTTMHNVLNTLWPGRFGKFYSFAFRYSNAERNDYGWGFQGLNPKHEKELRIRLKLLSSRTTKEEVAELLPPFMLQTKVVTKEERPTACVSLARDVLASGAPCVSILTYHRKNAEEMFDQILKAGMNPILITGEEPPKKRHETLQKAKDTPGAVLCMTMASIQESIDLTFCSYVIVAELYTRPATMIQVLGRFHRLSGSEPVTVLVLAERGYDHQAQKLARRLQDIAAVMSAGSSDKLLETELSKLKHEMSDKEFKDLFAEVSKGWDL